MQLPENTVKGLVVVRERGTTILKTMFRLLQMKSMNSDEIVGGGKFFYENSIHTSYVYNL